MTDLETARMEAITREHDAVQTTAVGMQITCLGCTTESETDDDQSIMIATYALCQLNSVSNRTVSLTITDKVPACNYC